MTTTLHRSGEDGQSGYLSVRQAGGVRPRAGYFRRHPAWPVVWMLAGWPVWWALGIDDFTVLFVAIPAGMALYRWRRSSNRRPIRVPPGFALWALFLLLMLPGAVTLPVQAPDTMLDPVSHTLISWGTRALLYIAITIVFLFVGNLTERELPRQRLAWLLGLVAIYAIVGGLLAQVDPSFHFTSPFAHVIPGSLQQANSGQIYSMLHPGLTQLESFQGHGRVAAPFIYTNAWGNDLAILLPWLIVGWRSYGTPRQRKVVLAWLVAGFVTAVLSFDRGLWIALVLTAVYLAVRSAAQRRLAALATLTGTLLVATVIVFTTPLASLISTRLANGTSDSARTNLAALSTRDALASPLIGWGDTRREYGSVKSIAVGRTANCPSCGQRSAGSNGQLWLVLITTGFPGSVCFLGFFVYAVWRYRRDKTPYGMAGELVILLSFIFMFVYDSVGATLTFTMLAYALLWRNDVARRQPEPVLAASAARPALNGAGRPAIEGGAAPA